MWASLVECEMRLLLWTCLGFAATTAGACLRLHVIPLL